MGATGKWGGHTRKYACDLESHTNYLVFNADVLSSDAGRGGNPFLSDNLAAVILN